MMMVYNRWFVVFEYQLPPPLSGDFGPFKKCGIVANFGILGSCRNFAGVLKTLPGFSELCWGSGTPVGVLRSCSPFVFHKRAWPKADDTLWYPTTLHDNPWYPMMPRYPMISHGTPKYIVHDDHVKSLWFLRPQSVWEGCLGRMGQKNLSCMKPLA